VSKSSQIWVGLDVHKESVSVAALREGEERPILQEKLGPSDEALRRVLRRLSREGRVQACYEAGGFGYVLHRKLTAWGYGCDVVAPSLIPVKPGDHVKTDRRDALKLATYNRGGELTHVYVPTEADERWRSVVRARRALQQDTHRTQQRILKLLQARGHFYREKGKNWSHAFMRWLEAVPLAEDDRFLITQYLAQRDMHLQLMQVVQKRIEELRAHERWGPALGRVQCLRGVDLLTASGLVVEIVDIGRFAGPRELMGWAGLGVTEFSSGEHVSRGAITKSGNSEVRRLLIEAAWNNTYPPRIGEPLRARLTGQDPAVVAHAWRAQQRLHDMWRRLGPRSPKLAITAMARVMLGFVYALWRARPEDLQSRS
jgi:transposase